MASASVHAYAWVQRWRPILLYDSASLSLYFVDDMFLQDTRPLTTHMAIPSCNGKETVVSEHSGRHVANTMSRRYRVQIIGADSLHVQVPSGQCTKHPRRIQRKRFTSTHGKSALSRSLPLRINSRTANPEIPRFGLTPPRGRQTKIQYQKIAQRLSRSRGGDASPRVSNIRARFRPQPFSLSWEQPS